jgi:hypothetical protein
MYMLFCGSVVNYCNVATLPALRVYFDVHIVLGGGLNIIIMRSLADTLNLHNADMGYHIDHA